MHPKLARQWYDFAAPFYDVLKRLFFPEINRITEETVRHFPQSRQILIIGGGAGSFLPLLTKLQPAANIDFIDISSKMLHLAQEHQLEQISYIQADIFDHRPNKKYDLIFCPFFLDHFNKETLTTLSIQFTDWLTNEGKVACVDFSSEEKSVKLIIVLRLAKLLLKLDIQEIEDSNSVFSKAFPKTHWRTTWKNNRYEAWIRKKQL